MCCESSSRTFVAGVPPIVTAAPATRFVPVMVIVVPPCVDPPTGKIPITFGGGGGLVDPEDDVDDVGDVGALALLQLELHAARIQTSQANLCNKGFVTTELFTPAA